MKTYVEKPIKVIDRIYCDVCGKICTDDNYGNEYATVEAAWGYASSQDGSKFDIQLCENCFGNMLGWMQEQRVEYLMPNYPIGYKDPLLGQ